MIFATGDCHADWRRFSKENFPEQDEMTREDFVIVCGDFGLWHDDKTERWWLEWFETKSFTLLFVDGNHENFDRLYSEFEVVDFHGGKAHKIRENIYHLMRGYVFELCGKKVFAFGGARSHDINDGILNPEDFQSEKELVEEYRRRTKNGEMLRINHISWWKEEMPTDEEMAFGLQTLASHANKVDFIVTHCGPQEIVSMCGYYDQDRLTTFFNRVLNGVEFSEWCFGHYHCNRRIGKFTLLYKQIVRVA